MALKMFSVVLIIIIFNTVVYASDINTDIEDSNEYDIQSLTVEQAFDIAVSYNRDILSYDEQLPLLLENYQETEKSKFEDDEKYISVKLQLARLQNTLDNYDDDVQKTKDILKYNITKLFSDILSAENEIKLEEKNVAVSRKELDISDIKYQKGLISKADFDTMNTEYIKKYNQLQNKKIELDNLFIDINKIMGIDLKSKYSIKLQFQYNKIDDINIDDKIEEEADNSIDIMQQKQDIDLSKYEYSTYNENDTYLSKLSKKYDILKQERDIQESEVNFYDSYNSVYKDILNKELSIEKYYDQLDLKEKELDVLNIKYSLGKAVSIDIEKKELEIAEIQNEIQNNISEHQLLVMKLQNVNLL